MITSLCPKFRNIENKIESQIESVRYKVSKTVDFRRKRPDLNKNDRINCPKVTDDDPIAAGHVAKVAGKLSLKS